MYDFIEDVINSWALLSLASSYLLWLLYLAIMNLKRAKDLKRLSLPAKIFGMPLLFVGYIVDAFVNVFVLTPILWEKPKVLGNSLPGITEFLKQEWLVTARLCRHANDEQNTWGKRVALWLGPNLLDDYDPSGKHIK